MNFTREIVLLALSISLLSMVGCATKLADQRTIELEVGEIKSVTLDPVNTEKLIKIVGTVKGGPINVHVFAYADEEEVERAITLGVDSEKVIAQQLDAKEISIEAKIPAKQESVVRFATAQKESANVSIEISE